MLKPTHGRQTSGFFLPLYPLLAQQCMDDYGLNRGVCLDIGCGSGYVGTEIAKITHLDLYFVDLETELLEMAQRTATEANIDNRVFFIKADVQALPFVDNFADFIISRGSIWFWQDKVKGLTEIYRVLKIGGTALIGGGFGRYVPITMRERLSGLRKHRLAKKGGNRLSLAEMEALAIKAEIPSFKVMLDAPGDKGCWLEMQKHVSA